MDLERELLKLSERLDAAEAGVGSRPAEAEDALARGLQAIGVTPLPVRWAIDGTDGLLEAARRPRHPSFEGTVSRSFPRGHPDSITSPSQGTPEVWAAWRRALASGSVASERVRSIESWCMQGPTGPFEGAIEEMSFESARATERPEVHRSWLPAPVDPERPEMVMPEPLTRSRHAGRSPHQVAHSLLVQTAILLRFASLRREEPDRPPWLDAVAPLTEAHAAGLWRFWVLAEEVIAVPFPEVRASEDRLHAEDGPAVSWPGGRSYWFWKGVRVPRGVIEGSLTLEQIMAEENVEIRRIMIERFGMERFMRASNGQRVHDDEYGTLWRLDLPDDEPLVMVEVVNATAEPDGSVRRYLLRVPPAVRTARAAVAWTFGVDEAGYDPEVQT